MTSTDVTVIGTGGDDEEGVGIEQPSQIAKTEAAAPAARERLRGRLLAPLAPRAPVPVDTSESILPAFLQDWEAFSNWAGVSYKRNKYRAKRGAWNAPIVLTLLCWYSPVGLGRLIKWASLYLYDADSAGIRKQHAGKTETQEYIALHRVRRANLHARWIVAGTVATAIAAPFLAYFSPLTLATLTSVLLFVYVVKLIPGRGLGEVLVATVVAVSAWFLARWGLTFLPELPTWPFVGALVVAVLTLGWIGKPNEPLTSLDASDYELAVEKPRAELVVECLIQCNIVGLTEKTQDEIRVYKPGVARAPRGYMLEMDLPGGVTASSVMDKREELAGALRRKLGTVWPSRGPNHPGHLRLFIADQPMTESPQSKWKVSEGKELDIFSPVDMFTDQQGKWVDLTFAYNHFVVGGQPGYGKSFMIRQIGVAMAFDPRPKIVCMDGKGNGDLRPLRLVAHGFYEGDEEDEIAEQLVAVKAIRQEMRRRNRFLRELPSDENPQNKVTSALVDKYPELAPIVLLVDEVQVYTEYDDDKVKKEFIAIFTDLVKRGRSAGIIPVFCTQKPDRSALPSRIADNCTMRVCFRVHGWQSNNQVLGSEMHASGVKATLFSTSDKGIAYLRGEAAEAQIVRTVHGLDQVAAEQLCAIARQIRQRKGTLSGYAAGDESKEEELQVDFLADCRRVMDEINITRIHLEPLRESLDLLREKTWGHLDVDALGGMLRAAGVPVRQVKVNGRNTSGIRREDLDVAATSDIEVADDEYDEDDS